MKKLIVQLSIYSILLAALIYGINHSIYGKIAAVSTMDRIVAVVLGVGSSLFLGNFSELITMLIFGGE